MYFLYFFNIKKSTKLKKLYLIPKFLKAKTLVTVLFFVRHSPKFLKKCIFCKRGDFYISSLNIEQIQEFTHEKLKRKLKVIIHS